MDWQTWSWQERLVKLSTEWLEVSGAGLSAVESQLGFAHLKHYTAEYCEFGDGPPLVLIPGLAGGYGLLAPLARRLAERFHVICYQLRGEDDCFALRQRFGLQDLVADLKQLIEHLGLERPSLLGVSFGGALAIEYAARFPSDIDRVVIQGCGARFDRGLLQWIAGMVLSCYPLPSDNPLVNQFFNLLFGGKQAHGPLFQFVTRQCWQTDQSVMAHRFRMIKRINMLRRLERISAPMLALAGDRDLLVSERSFAALSEGAPHAQLMRLQNAGHLAFLTQPHRVAQEAARFLLDERR
jgi:pimeloyl-ACP methyl ester carboxylesterase